MPEGDSVYKVARKLEPALVGQRLTRGELRVPAHLVVPALPALKNRCDWLNVRQLDRLASSGRVRAQSREGRGHKVDGMPDWFPRTLGEVIAFVPLRILFLVLVAVVARVLVHRVINRTIEQSLLRAPVTRFRAAQVLFEVPGAMPERRAARISALGTLAKSIVTVVVILLTALMVLSELGFNITTIVAGTSVVAVTVAFGVQNIVKDLISGVFMLIEDQLGVGDWVDMEKASGRVEAIGLRVTSLRDDDGTVWYVRNGEVLRVGNFSQGGAGRPPVAAEPEPAPSPTP